LFELSSVVLTKSYDFFDFGFRLSDRFPHLEGHGLRDLLSPGFNNLCHFFDDCLSFLEGFLAIDVVGISCPVNLYLEFFVSEEFEGLFDLSSVWIFRLYLSHRLVGMICLYKPTINSHD
jgi:hypothetical protein